MKDDIYSLIHERIETLSKERHNLVIYVARTSSTDQARNETLQSIDILDARVNELIRVLDLLRK